jgi:hypothetical protein
MALSVGAYLSRYDEVLKTFYLPAVQEQLNNTNFLSSIIEVNETDISGKNATMEMHYGRSTGVGARADGGDLPSADYQKFKTAIVPMKYLYGRVTFSGPTIAATRDEKGAYARVVDTEITGIVDDLKREVNRQLWGCGYGVLARWRTTVGATSYTLQKQYRANTAGGDGFGSTFGAKYLDEMNNAVPVVLTVSTSVIIAATVDATNIAVSAITEATGYDTITCTNPSVTEAAGTWYIRPASGVSITTASAAGAFRLEMMGIRGIVTDTNIQDIILYGQGTSINASLADPLQGLAVATYGWWKANVDSYSTRYGGQRALTFNLMQKMFDKVEKKAGEGYGPDVILTTRAIRREYLDLCQADRRSVNTMTLDGGWVALDYNGIPLMVDNDAIDGEMYFLTTKDLQLYRMADYDWMQKDGAILSRLSGYDAYEAVLYRYAELGCLRRNSQGVLCDLDYEAD